MLIIYLDTSALLKQYIGEPGAPEVERLLHEADIAGTVIVTRAEIASAMSRAVRTGMISQAEGEEAWKEFQKDWPQITLVLVSEQLVERAASVAWKYRLHGYDAVHLAAALLWEAALAAPVTLATFDRELWLAGREAGLAVWPEALAA